MSGDSELVTMREAARRLGLVSRGAPRRAQDRAARRLRDLLERREKESGLKVIASTVSPKSPCVALSAIRAACPEFRETPDQVDEVRRLVAHLDERIDARIIAYTEPRFSEQSQTNDVLASGIRHLYRRQEGVEGRLGALELHFFAPPCTQKGAKE
jgi:hypothetical protein